MLNAEGMVDMEVSGAETLAALLDDLDARGTRLVLARVRSSLRTTLRRLGVEQRLGTANTHLSVRDAVRSASGALAGSSGTGSGTAAPRPPAVAS